MKTMSRLRRRQIVIHLLCNVLTISSPSQLLVLVVDFQMALQILRNYGPNLQVVPQPGAKARAIGTILGHLLNPRTLIRRQ
jgi:hypothetical protein